MNAENPHIEILGAESIDFLSFFNFKEMVHRVIHDIFRDMVSLPLELSNQTPTLTGPLLASTIQFTGMINGHVRLYTTLTFARIVAASLAGIALADIDESLACDTIGELTNMVSGNLHSDLCNTGLKCVLNIPKVNRAESGIVVDGKESEILLFTHNGHQLLITLNLQQVQAQ